MSSSTRNRYDNLNLISSKENIVCVKNTGNENVRMHVKEGTYESNEVERSNAGTKKRYCASTEEVIEIKKKRRVLGDISNRQSHNADTNENVEDSVKPNRIPSGISTKEKRIGLSQLSRPAIRNIKQPVLTDATPVGNGSPTEEDEIEFPAGGLSPPEVDDDDLRVLENEIKASLEECNVDFWDCASANGDDGEAHRVIDLDFAREAEQSPLPEDDPDDTYHDHIEEPDTYEDDFVDEVESQFLDEARCDSIAEYISRYNEQNGAGGMCMASGCHATCIT